MYHPTPNTPCGGYAPANPVVPAFRRKGVRHG